MVGLGDLFQGLDASDGFLDFGIGVLHAERGAVEAGTAQRLHLFNRQATRINFDPRFDGSSHWKVCADCFAEPLDFRGLEKGGGSAAELDLDGFGAFGNEARA